MLTILIAFVVGLTAGLILRSPRFYLYSTDEVFAQTEAAFKFGVKMGSCSNYVSSGRLILGARMGILQSLYVIYLGARPILVFLLLVTSVMSATVIYRDYAYTNCITKTNKISECKNLFSFEENK